MAFTVGSRLAVLSVFALTTACGDDTTNAPGPDAAVGATTGGRDATSAGDALSSGSAGAGGAAGGTGGARAEECAGPFDPDGNGNDDGPRRESPSAPDVVAACEAFCDAIGDVCTGELARQTCVDHCRLRACEACRGTWVPVVDCERAETDPDACECDDGVPTCPVAPGRCSDYLDATRQCGR